MRILVVDDEVASRGTLEVFTRRLGYDVLTACNGTEAYEIWKRERPKIVITDWNMPGMDGLELCARIRYEEGEDYTYIIVVTGRNDIRDVIRGMQSGADDYIVKPFNKDELYVRIKAGERIIYFQSKDIVIFALAKLAESRDEDTCNHLERVRNYTKYLAETIADFPDSPPELNRHLIDNIIMTSALHDIGKVGIPDYVLLKPGRLDEAEFEIMKTHSEIGYNTLHEALMKAPRADYLKLAAEIARHHHEKYNGGGYPDGLAGDSIPLSCRIFALSDVYDALVSKRPYKEPFSHERAMAIIVEAKGEHFDPMVVEAFLKCEQGFAKIREEFSD